MSDVLERLDPANFVDIDLQTDIVRQLFPGILADWAKRPPFYILQNGNPQAIIARHADMKEVLNGRGRFAAIPPATSTPGMRKFVPNKFMKVTPPTQMEGPPHARIRRLINPAFSEGAVKRFEPVIAARLSAMIDRIEQAGPEFEAMGALCSQLMPEVMLEAMFGFSPEERRIFVAMNHCLRLTKKLKPDQDYPTEYVEAFDLAEVTINAIIADRRAHPRDDLVTELIAASDDGDVLTDLELFELIFVFGAGAIESTASSFAAALMLLGKHPDQFDELKADPGLIPAAIDECMRIHGPGFLLFTRYALVDTEVGGTFLPAGIPVYVSHQAAALDPVQYPDPLRFDIHRNPANVTVFGGGAHFCVGNRLAKTVMRIALTELVTRFPGLRLADPDFKPNYVGSLSETQIEKLPMLLA
ncbi:MAG: putative cytochrome [Rhizorhabdus sp.]|nr:putative cytochrome [Rhizorhabdus sp.]